MAACIFSFRIKKIWRIIECLLIIRSHHTRFNGNCLVCFIKLKNAVHMRIHYQHHTAFNRFESKIYTGAPAIHINRNLLPVAVFHNLLHILFAAWIHHKIRVSSVFPFFCRVSGDIHGTTAFADFLNFFLQVSCKTLFTLCKSHKKAASAGFETTKTHNFIDDSPFYTIKLQCNIRLFRIGNSKNCRHAALCLGNFPCSIDSFLPGRKYKSKPLPVLRHVPEDFTGCTDKDTV